VLDTINNDANAQAAGITASLDSNGKLSLTSSSFFAVSSDTAGGASQTSVAGAGGAINDIAVTGSANKSTLAISAGTAGSTQTLAFTGKEIGYENTALNVSFGTAATAAAGATAAADSVNNSTTLRSAGVFAIQTKADGSEVQVISLKNFDLGVSSTAGTVNGTNNVDAQQTATAAAAGTATGGATGAKAAVEAIKAAVGLLGQVQGKVGAGQNNLEQAIDLVSSQLSSFQAAESAIRDADVAAEASSLARLTTLQQAGVAALAQANQSSQVLLSLLR
jgi:flagellin-like hook-associated protein FlgL